MSFPVIIIFLVLCLWVAICFPLLASSYLDGVLADDYYVIILLSLWVSMVMTCIIVTTVVVVFMV